MSITVSTKDWINIIPVNPCRPLAMTLLTVLMIQVYTRSILRLRYRVQSSHSAGLICHITTCSGEALTAETRAGQICLGIGASHLDTSHQPDTDSYGLQSVPPTIMEENSGISRSILRSICLV